MNYVMDIEDGGILLTERGKKINIYVSQNESQAVKCAANNLLGDIYKVCRCSGELSNDVNECKLIIGTIGKSKAIDKMIEEGNLDVYELQKNDGSLVWEGYQLKNVGECLYIIGTDSRGTIFGIYDLCEAMGVSPWYYFADVPVKKKNYISIPKNFCKTDSPSIMYRGIFINDEEELNAWAISHTKDGTIGPETYRHVFELLLRLKANYIWPAMHVNYFNENPENGKMAKEMGIVVGTSHCDMLLRSNQNEWEPWIEKKKYKDISYDYSIQGRNREILKEYWRESVEQNKDYEVCYTVGMRGIHDYGFKTEVIDKDSTLTSGEKQAARVKLLGEVIRDQRNILKDVLHNENTLQIFIPYKEVLPLYDNGLELSEDITLIWVNDNFGYMRRFPDQKELKRSGGHGLYYHSSYWGHPGMSYLFINSIPLAHTGNELRKSYESGIRKIWVLNVGSIKPLEQDIEYFLKYGWEVGKEETITKDAFEFTKHWIDNNFSGGHGEEAAKLYDEFTQLTNVCKVEHMYSDVFSQTTYGDEAGRRLNKLKEIFHRANNIYYALSENEKEAFFQMFLMKIHASYYINHEFYYADRSTLSYNQGKMQCADFYLELSRKMCDYKRAMLYFYNKKMSDGKWDKILTPESFPPPCTALYPAGKPALKIGNSEMDVIVWNEKVPNINHQSITFSPYGIREKWLEIFNKGAGNIHFDIRREGCDEWISLSEASGEIIGEKRILLSVSDWALASGHSGCLVINDIITGKSKTVVIETESGCSIPDKFEGYVEAEGYISIIASKYNGKMDFNYSKWIVIKNIGRYEGDAVQAVCHESLEKEVKKNPYLEYNILFESEGDFLLEIYRFLTLNSKGKIRFGVGVDGDEPIIVESEITDEWRGEWKSSVVSNGEKMYLKLPFINSGMHKLRLYVIDNYVTISKMIIYTNGFINTNLGPEISYHTKYNLKERNRNELPLVHFEELEKIRTEQYRTEFEEVDLPRIIYADKNFWKYNRLYMPNEEYGQQHLGEKKYMADSNGGKDIISKFGCGVFEEKDGKIAIEAEYALEESENAYLTKSMDGQDNVWSHTQSETNGRSGLAMYVSTPGIEYKDVQKSPGMHYRIHVNNGGMYNVWLLVKFDDNTSDSCYVALDGKIQPLAYQKSGGSLFTFSTQQIWFWTLLSELEILKGIHTFSIYARKSRFRIDRIYLTKGDELPWSDAQWKDSVRNNYI